MAALPESADVAEERNAAVSAGQTWYAPVLRLVRLGTPPTLVFIAAVTLWQLASWVGVLNKFVAPTPMAIARICVSLLGQSFLWSAARMTLFETVIGFAIGISAGFFVGMLTALFPLFRRSVYPHTLAFQIIPRSALAPLFLLWFGFGMASKVVMAASMAFFPLVINTAAGVQSVDRDAQLLMRSLGVSRWQMFRYLILPSAAPLIAAGVKLGLTLALIGSVVGEFVGGAQGLGVLLTQFQTNLDTPRVYAIIIFLALMGLILYGFIAWLEKKVIFWTNVSVL